MRRVFLSLALLLLTSCQGVVGPSQRVCNPRPIAPPCTPISEQERNRRDNLALPDPSPAVGPRTYTEPPGPYYSPPR